MITNKIYFLKNWYAYFDWRTASLDLQKCNYGRIAAFQFMYWFKEHVD